MIKRFEHINLSCENLQASQQFYQTLFPDWYIRAGNQDDENPWIHLGDDHFYLALNHHPELSRVHHLYENIGVNHVGFVIDSGEAMKTLLDQQGIEYYTMTAPETKYRIYVNDPDGNEIELVEYNADYLLK